MDKWHSQVVYQKYLKNVFLNMYLFFFNEQGYTGIAIDTSFYSWLYINDIVDNTTCNIKLFVDNTSLYTALEDLFIRLLTWSFIKDQIGQTNGK